MTRRKGATITPLVGGTNDRKGPIITPMADVGGNGRRGPRIEPLSATEAYAGLDLLKEADGDLINQGTLVDDGLAPLLGIDQTPITDEMSPYILTDPRDVARTAVKDRVGLLEPSIKHAALAPDFGSSKTGALELGRWLIETFQHEYLEWKPETLWAEIEHETHTPHEKLDLCVRDKIQALQLLHLNDLAWKDWTVFEKVAVTFNCRQPLFDQIQYLSAPDLALAVMTMNKIRAVDFESEIQAYVAARLHEEGFVLAPHPLGFAQERLNDLARQPVLKSTVEKNWPRVRKRDPEQVAFDENPVGVQLARLAAVAMYVAENLK